MEPYDFKIQQLTYSEDQLKDGSLDSFSNVIHYDSALLDQKTGTKHRAEQIDQSQQFAWASSRQAVQRKEGFLPTPFQTNTQVPNLSSETVLPTPFQAVPVAIETSVTQTISSSSSGTPRSTTGDFACQLSQLIKDVYSGVDVPFSPLKDQTSIPEWIFLQHSACKDEGCNRQPEHIFAQPSRVKVTHVYNQTVWSQVPTTAPYNQSDKGNHSTDIRNLSTDNHLTLHADYRPGVHSQKLHTNSISAGASVTKPANIPSRGSKLNQASDIQTLRQISQNTAVAKKYQKQHSLNKMAESLKDSENPDPSQPFESVADALHLQQSVIGSRTGITPVSADVVAQIVAEAERKIKMGLTPTSTEHKPFEEGSNGSATVLSEKPAFTLPPVPQVPDLATTRELIRIHSVDITRSSRGLARQTPTSQETAQRLPRMTGQPSVQNSVGSVPPGGQKSVMAPEVVSGSLGLMNNGEITSPSLDNLPDEDRSIASTNSELEALGDSATDSFLQSLPPFRAVNLSEIMPENRQLERRHSPPVKETSFRPVTTAKLPSSATALESQSGLQSFGLDSGVFSPDSDKVFSPPPSHIQSKTNFVVPKPGPLFHSTPRAVLPVKRLAAASPQAFSRSDSNSQLEEVRREKAKLEGQLEMLSIEAQATLQERAELQAQVASLKLKLMSQKSQKTDAEKDVLKADLESLKQLRVNLEQSLSELQHELEEKSEEGRNLQEDLNQSQEQCDRLNLKMKEIRDDLKTKEMTIQALKSKVAELYVEVQTSLQSRMESENEARTARSDLVTLQSTRDWYQQQLEIASKARSELQKELTVLQAQTLSQSNIIDRLKSENVKLRQQFTDIQNKALKEKELLAKHLETIESDMLDREAAFQEIQRERSFLEDTFNSKIQTAEDEKNRIGLLMQMTNDLENQLDKAHNDLKKKQNQINQLETENIELMKKLRLSQETVVEKETFAEDLKHNVIEMEAKLKAFQNSLAMKDTELLALKEDKAKTEIALNAALQEKNAVDKVLDGVKMDMGKVESSFKLMRQELTNKSAEMNKVKTISKDSEERIESLKKELENERRAYELAKSEFENKSKHSNELQSQKINLESEVLLLREKLVAMEASHEEAMREKQFLDAELGATREKLEELKAKIGAQQEREENELQKSESVINTEEYQKLQEECVQLREQISNLGKANKKDLVKQKAKSAKLSQDLNAVKTELMDRQKTFDENIELLSGKLREVAAERDKLETELTMVHRKYELSMLEQKDHIDTELQNLASELEQVRLEKQAVQSQVGELQHARDSDIHQYQQQLSALEEELRVAMEEKSENSVTMETNQNLLLELEKEKGRLAGVQQSNVTLKQHVSQLEEALAARESTLVDLQAQWTQALREKEAEAQYSIKRVQGLEESLQKEKEAQREARKQIGLKITENKKIKRQNDVLKQDQEQMKLDLARHEQEVSQLQSELDTSKEEVISRQGEISTLESENKSIQRELERVQQQLYDNLSREPVLQEQIKGLQWQLQLKSQELESAREQLQHSEDRHQGEINTVKQLLNERTSEMEGLKSDLATMKHEKQQQQAKLTELRSALKSSIHYHKLVDKISRLHSPSSAGDAMQELPPLPFDLTDMDKLLQETTVRALESKPLDNLQNCLLNLRSEISGLQAQMDAHNHTLETSTHTWSTIEQQVEELRHVVQTISNTTMSTATTASLAAAAVDTANRSMDIIDI